MSTATSDQDLVRLLPNACREVGSGADSIEQPLIDRKWTEAATTACLELQRRHRPMVKAILSSRGVRDVDLDLLCDKVLDAIWSRPINPERSVRNWLGVIARNKAISYGRRAQPKVFTGHSNSDAPSLEQTIEDPSALTPDEKVAIAERDAELLQLVSQLPGGMRAAVELRVLRGWAIPDIARAQGLSVKQISAAKYRGLQKLRQKLEGRHAS